MSFFPQRLEILLLREPSDFLKKSPLYTFPNAPSPIILDKVMSSKWTSQWSVSSDFVLKIKEIYWDISNTLILWFPPLFDERAVYRPMNPRQSWILDSMPWIPDSTPSQWNLGTGFQSLVGFRILWAVFRIPTSTIPDFTNKVFPGFGFHKQNFRIPLLGRGGRGWGGAGWVGVISRSPERQKCYLRH